jgi:Ribosomal protein L11 methylase
MINSLRLLRELTTGGFFISFFTGIPKRIRNRRLCRKFQFHPWHINPVEHRLYALRIVEHLNATFADHHDITVVEIGCGLAEILEKLNAATKKGYDIDPNVVAAASYLHKNRNDLVVEVGSFDRVSVATKIDCLITVNFIHDLPEEFLKNSYDELFRRAEIKLLVVDEVRGPGYPHNHQIRNLIPPEFEIVKTDQISEIRKVIYFSNKNVTS